MFASFLERLRGIEGPTSRYCAIAHLIVGAMCAMEKTVDDCDLMIDDNEALSDGPYQIQCVVLDTSYSDPNVEVPTSLHLQLFA